MADKQRVCCVCGDSKEIGENQLFTCKGHGCDVIVHRACYGIVSVPTGLWFCRKCESQERAARVRCELCPKKEGALKRTDTGGWAHVVCALYIPEATFGNNRTMEPIITSKLPKEKFSKPCYICEDAGLETQATHGACMYCHKPSCRMAFHVTCGQKERLLCEEPDARDPNNLVYCGYCHNHYKKMVRQKKKQEVISHKQEIISHKQSSSERPVSTSTLPYTAPVPATYSLTSQLPQLSFQLPLSIRSISPPLPVSSVTSRPLSSAAPPCVQGTITTLSTTTTVSSTTTAVSPTTAVSATTSVSAITAVSVPSVSTTLLLLTTASTSLEPVVSMVTTNSNSSFHQSQALQQHTLHTPQLSSNFAQQISAPLSSLISLHAVPSSLSSVLGPVSSQLSLVLPIQIPTSFHSHTISQVAQAVSSSVVSVSQSSLPLVSQAAVPQPLASQAIVPQPTHALLQLAFPQSTPHLDLNKGVQGTQRARREETHPVPQKRVSVDTPMPSTKRKCRRRKLSSSNESTFSEALSVISDIAHLPRIPPISPSVAVSGSVKLSQDAPPRARLGADVIPTNGGTHTFSVSSSAAVVSPAAGLLHHTSESSTSGLRALGPPMDLQELLERQWEQTAQFIIQQGGGHQNNAGVMLAHLHQLQSENRRMQSRIMELASQREFYIATNTRLHQTLTEHDLSAGTKMANGSCSNGEKYQSGGYSASSSTQVYSASSSTQVSPVTAAGLPHINESQNMVLKSAPNVVSAAQPCLALHNGGHSMEMALHVGQQGNSLMDFDHLAVRPTSTAGGRAVTLRGTPDVTHVTDSIQAPISTFAALSAGSAPQWCD